MFLTQFVSHLALGGLLFLIFFLASCKKLVTIPEPVNSITTTEAYSTDVQANSTIAGIYTQMINSASPDFCSGGITIYCGMSSDELIDFAGSSDANGYQFNSNTLLSTNGTISANFWTSPYKYIYTANAAIAGLTTSTGVHDSVRNELIGEAKFIRAFCYFYLTNLFGDVPLVLTTDWNKTALMSKGPQVQIYKQIEQDLIDAENALPSDYSVGLGERIRPNKSAATALLARVYLYEQKWADAENQATAIINNSQYSLVGDLSSVFNANSTEAIWQLQQNNTFAPNFNGTWDGRYFIPSYSFNSLPPNTQTYVLSHWNKVASLFIPSFYLSSELSKAFESGDQRKEIWAGNNPTPTDTIYFPIKYTLPNKQTTDGGTVAQYYMILRLAEQYLIRAEARAWLGENGATDDINAIRNRAGLPNTTVSSQTDLLDAIYHERQVELFAEWGHRWLDLKRTGKATSVLSSISIKQPWSANSLLYPIPLTELNVDPSLKQNEGY